MSEPSSHTKIQTPLEGKRQTVQRHQIIDTLEKAQGPLTAAQIYELTRYDGSDVGLSTVYRTLKMLIEAEQVRLVTLPDGVARYEKAGRGAHHFQCRTCGRIWTLLNGTVASFRGSRLVGGFLIEDHESTFHGQCSSCNSLARNG